MYTTSQSSIFFYFILNLFVTVTNKQILGASSGNSLKRPYCLTAAHALASLIGSTIFNHLALRTPGPPELIVHETSTYRQQPLTWNQYGWLAIFSLFYSINISLSNLSLGMISLPLNQAIRATAPLLTVMISIFIMQRPLRSYSMSTCLSLVPITLGVMVAANDVHTASNAKSDSKEGTFPQDIHNHHATGIFITLMGAITAVLKTILTHKLMTNLSLNLSPVMLLQILSPYAAVQAIVFAFTTGEIDSPHVDYFLPPTYLYHHSDAARMAPTLIDVVPPKSMWLPEKLRLGTATLWLINAIAAFLLNIASFEANKRCGPVSMAVAANLKQVAILTLPLFNTVTYGKIMDEEEVSGRVVVGTLMTVVGGIWYAWEMSKSKSRRAMQSNIHPSEIKLPH